jgi:hypothetical protein
MTLNLQNLTLLYLLGTTGTLQDLPHTLWKPQVYLLCSTSATDFCRLKPPSLGVFIPSQGLGA